MLNGVKLSQALLTYYAVSDKVEYYPRTSLLSLSTVSLTRLNQAVWAAMLNGHVGPMSVLLYADDIILLAPSVTSLQQLLLVCEHELYLLDMAINAKSPHA